MNDFEEYYKNKGCGLCVLLAFFLSIPLLAQEDPGNNQSADNFSTNTNNSTVNSNNQTTANNTTYNGAGSSPGSMPVNSAISPSLMSNGMDSCLMSTNGGIQSFGVGLSTGAYRQDENCNRRRDAKLLMDLNMKVASIALMCQDPNVWEAMFVSGTPCPILVGSKLVAGRSAYLIIKQNPELYIPNYGTIKTIMEPYYKCRRFVESKKIIDCDKKTSFKSVKKYTPRQEFFNTILNINSQNANEQTIDNTLSLSARFRSSTKSSS